MIRTLFLITNCARIASRLPVEVSYLRVLLLEAAEKARTVVFGDFLLSLLKLGIGRVFVRHRATTGALKGNVHRDGHQERQRHALDQDAHDQQVPLERHE